MAHFTDPVRLGDVGELVADNVGNLTRTEADIRIAMLTAKLRLLDEPPHTL